MRTSTEGLLYMLETQRQGKGRGDSALPRPERSHAYLAQWESRAFPPYAARPPCGRIRGLRNRMPEGVLDAGADHSRKRDSCKRQELRRPRLCRRKDWVGTLQQVSLRE